MGHPQQRQDGEHGMQEDGGMASTVTFFIFLFAARSSLPPELRVFFLGPAVGGVERRSWCKAVVRLAAPGFAEWLVPYQVADAPTTSAGPSELLPPTSPVCVCASAAAGLNFQSEGGGGGGGPRTGGGEVCVDERAAHGACN
jgi:hypothetical protein